MGTDDDGKNSYHIHHLVNTANALFAVGYFAAVHDAQLSKMAGDSEKHSVDFRQQTLLDPLSNQLNETWYDLSSILSLLASFTWFLSM